MIAEDSNEVMPDRVVGVIDYCNSSRCFICTIWNTLCSSYATLHQQQHHHRHHWAPEVSHGWAKASGCRLWISLSCAVLCNIVFLMYLSRSSCFRLAGLPWRLFVLYGQERISLLNFVMIVIVLPLTIKLVLMSLFVMLNIFISIFDSVTTRLLWAS